MIEDEILKFIVAVISLTVIIRLVTTYIDFKNSFSRELRKTALKEVEKIYGAPIETLRASNVFYIEEAEAVVVAGLNGIRFLVTLEKNGELQVAYIWSPYNK